MARNHKKKCLDCGIGIKSVSTRCRKCWGLTRRIPRTPLTDYTPKLGESMRGWEIGKAGGPYVWAACVDCGKTAWVQRQHLYRNRVLPPGVWRCQACTNIAKQIPEVEIGGREPRPGEITTPRDIGSGKRKRHIWRVCGACGNGEWLLYCAHPVSPVCRVCTNVARNGKYRGPKNPAWKGGRQHTKDGYILVSIQPGDPFYAMNNGSRYVLEHRLVMAQHLGRPLTKDEVVHHRNGIKDDNRIENLELARNGEHSKAHSEGYQDGYAQGLIDGRTEQVRKLKSLIEEQSKRIKVLEALD